MDLKQLQVFKRSLAKAESKYVVTIGGVRYFDIRQLMRDKGHIK